MLLKHDIDKSGFDQLLKWLSKDSEESAKKYSEIHYKLILFFAARNCSEAEDLADETINRVIKKITTQKLDYEGNKIKYFYGFAKNIYKEYLRDRSIQLNEEILESKTSNLIEINDGEVSDIVKILNTCLKKINKKDKKLILTYYNVESGREMEYRKKIAKRFGLTVNLLRVKVFRIKNNLSKCVENSTK